MMQLFTAYRCKNCRRYTHDQVIGSGKICGPCYGADKMRQALWDQETKKHRNVKI